MWKPASCLLRQVQRNYKHEHIVFATTMIPRWVKYVATWISPSHLREPDGVYCWCTLQQPPATLHQRSPPSEARAAIAGEKKGRKQTHGHESFWLTCLPFIKAVFTIIDQEPSVVSFPNEMLGKCTSKPPSFSNCARLQWLIVSLTGMKELSLYMYVYILSPCLYISPSDFWWDEMQCK